LQADEHIINCFIYNEKDNENKVLVIASKKNMIKRTKLDDLSVSRLNKPSTIMKLDDNDEIIGCLLTIENNTSDSNDLIGTITKTGSVLLYPINQINIIGKNGSGVKNLNTAEDISSIFIDNPTNAFLVLGANQGAKKIKRELLPIGKRTGKPTPMIASYKMEVMNGFEVNNTSTINILYDDKIVFTSAKDIIVGNANTKLFPIRGHKIIAFNNTTLFNEIKNDEKTEEISLFDK
jgi:DNA gyrase/topoisomerase IV subunit A